MEFSNTVNGQGILQDIDFLCGSTSASYALVDKVRNVNAAYHDTTRLIWEVCDSWQYDDANKGDYPRVLTTLTGGTKTYTIPSTAQKIRRVEIKDINGDWVKLEPLDYKDIGGSALLEYLETDALPQYYDLIGNYIALYPTPAATKVTTSSGMAVYIDRDITIFTSASTTAIPGFAPPFHRILSLQASIDFEKDPNQQKKFLMDKTQLVEGLKRFYSSRSVERRAEITPSGKRRRHQYE